MAVPLEAYIPMAVPLEAYFPLAVPLEAYFPWEALECCFPLVVLERSVGGREASHCGLEVHLVTEAIAVHLLTVVIAVHLVMEVHLVIGVNKNP